MLAGSIRKFVKGGFLAALIGTVVLADGAVQVGYGGETKWSPGDVCLSYLRGDSLFVVMSNDFATATCIDVGPILRYEWLSDSCLLIQQRYQEKRKSGTLITDRITRVCLDGNRTELIADSGIVGKDNRRRLSVTKLSNGDVGYFDDASGQSEFHGMNPASPKITETKLKGYWVSPDPIPDGKIWLHYGSETNKRLLTQSENHYALPQLSPTSDRFFCKSQRGDLVVFDTLGNELSNLGRVDFPVWSKDGKWIAFCETAFTEFDIVGSDVCIARFDGSLRRKLTDTRDVIEVEPVFSPTGKKLIYREYRSGKLIIVDTEN